MKRFSYVHWPDASGPGRPAGRLTTTGIRGLTEAQKATLRGLGATEDTPVPSIQ